MNHLDRRRRKIRNFLRIFIALFLFVVRFTRSSYAFDETSNMHESKVVSNEITVSKFVVPPQPRDHHGKLTCTKDRYIQGERQIGMASWYGNEFNGKPTASGKLFNQNANTIAHLTLPMGTKVIVENPENGKSFAAQVTDCGPFVKGRIADLSKGLALRLGIVEKGTGEVIIHVI